MRICGVDPGLEATGYGVIDVAGNHLTLVAAGSVRSSAQESLTLRLGSIYEKIIRLLEQHKPDLIVLEELYSHYKHPTTAILMGHARGAVLLAAAHRRLKMKHYSATHIKKAVTGRGHATKDQIQRMIQALLNVSTAGAAYDTTDALAAAIAHAHTLRSSAAAEVVA
ncbi:MAG: crossover junction endodeoxyribonuclease RuvC [Candidatus Omnitrophica bacterium]|nr:crossover junction endodeoxyribonuclease RuvC [Candidatus Omnitrophota bacterium]